MVGTSCMPWSSGVSRGDNAMGEEMELILHTVGFGVEGRDKGWCFHSNIYCWADGLLCFSLVGAVSECVVLVLMRQNTSSILFVHLLQLEEKKLPVNVQ